jgi:hypothetical protein
MQKIKISYWHGQLSSRQRLGSNRQTNDVAKDHAGDEPRSSVNERGDPPTRPSKERSSPNELELSNQEEGSDQDEKLCEYENIN